MDEATVKSVKVPESVRELARRMIDDVFRDQGLWDETEEWLHDRIKKEATCTLYLNKKPALVVSLGVGDFHAEVPVRLCMDCIEDSDAPEDFRAEIEGVDSLMASLAEYKAALEQAIATAERD